MTSPFEDAIGYRFKDAALLKEALSHRSYASESKTDLYNERLEFLGDSILSAAIAHYCYVNLPQEREGTLSKIRSQFVSRASLAEWAREIGLGAHLLLGVGEESSGGRNRQSVLANALEALLGAIFLDGGYGAAAAFIDRWCQTRLEGFVETDYKSRLQELLQSRFKSTPSYELLQSSGPDHDRTFSVLVHLNKRTLGQGTGKSKKEAEQAAARDALKSLAPPRGGE
ncbi:MAG: ribonuclease III [Elusimicrobia bacterium]|nr:ribonuclease III [Elusimicrobiota bacterium]